MSEARESEFRGRPVLVLAEGAEDKFPFTFGLRKAKLILENLDKIKEFVGKHEGETGKTATK